VTSVPLKSSLRAALAVMLQQDAGFVTVDDEGQFVGILTPADLHAAMRRSVGGEPAEL